jgi:hypothetical protein
MKYGEKEQEAPLGTSLSSNHVLFDMEDYLCKQRKKKIIL